MQASRSQVESFLKHTQFEKRNARVALPHGLFTPGKDMTPRFDQILPVDMTGMSVLDVGTYYGGFLAEAVKRGAERVVGLEPDAGRYRIAKEAARINGETYEVVNSTLEDYRSDSTFDLVIVLAVLHHVPDPFDLMRKAAEISRGEIIVEIQDFNHPKALFQTYESAFWRWRGPQNFRLWKGRNGPARIHSWLLRILAADLPLVMVGNREIKTTYYFSPKAFRNAFKTHARLFSSVDFEPSVKSDTRFIARCRV